MTLDDGAVGVSALNAWDIDTLRRSVAAMQLIAERLSPWVTRVSALGAQLGAAECWSGPAASVAGAQLAELRRVGDAVGQTLADSGTELSTVVAAATEAQEHAATALVVAASGPVTLAEDGTPSSSMPAATSALLAQEDLTLMAAQEQAGRRAAAWAREAFEAADRAASAAAAASESVAMAGVLDGSPPVDFSGLAAGTPVVMPVMVAPGADPLHVTDWWSGLTPAEQQAAITTETEAVGRLDGLPAWARDQANRQLLENALTDPTAPGYDTASAVAGQLTALQVSGQPAQLVLFDPAEELVALSVGDLDSAEAVGVLVPGMGTTPADDLAGMTVDARAVHDRAEAAAPGLAVATMVWLGYQTPGWPTVTQALNARAAGPVLDRTLDGLAATRAGQTAAGGPRAPRVTLVAHSYGTLVAGEAARAEGELAADAVVLLGSPGTGPITAAGFEAEEVYGAWAAADPISWSGWFGSSPFDGYFGDQPLPVDPTQWHTEYYDPEHPTLQSIAEVVAGVR